MDNSSLVNTVVTAASWWSSCRSRQNMRECRWCQPQFESKPRTDEDVSAAPWECVRIPGQERPVTEEECAECEAWDPDYSF